MRIDRFRDKELGWHFHLYIGDAINSAIGFWWTKRCDFGVNVGKREVRFPL